MSRPAVYVNAAVEGLLDAAVARRLLEHAGLTLGHLQGQRGKDWLDGNLRAYNNGAQRQPWLVLRDLDHDAPCAPALVARLLPRRFEGLRLRICVRAVDAWLLADHERLSAFLQVPERLCRHSLSFSPIPSSRWSRSHAARAACACAKTCSPETARRPPWGLRTRSVCASSSTAAGDPTVPRAAVQVWRTAFRHFRICGGASVCRAAAETALRIR